MPPKKELSKHQLSHRLQFQSHTPNFLRAFQAQVSGFRTGGPGDDDEDGPSYANGDEFRDEGSRGGQDEFGRDLNGFEPAVDEFGREIRRETSAEPKETSNAREGGGKVRRGGGDEEEEDEMPQVVVLKEGKHLSAREAENERRRARGLSPLPDLDQDTLEREEAPTFSQSTSKSIPHRSATSGQAHPKSSKSGVQLGVKAGGAKRKVPVGGRDDEQNEDGPVNKKLKSAEGGGLKKEKKDKGKKKAVKGLLSFGDDG